MNTNLTVLTNKNTDPSTLGWPATLPLEVALQTAPLEEIKDSYNISDEEWEALRTNDQFRREVLKYQEEAKEEGYSFRTKAKMQAEGLLATSWSLIHNEDTPAAVKADLIKFTTRIAGYEPNPKSAAEMGTAFQININMGGQSASATIPNTILQQQLNPMNVIHSEYDDQDAYDPLD
jgi:hypothetical protein